MPDVEIISDNGKNLWSNLLQEVKEKSSKTSHGSSNLLVLGNTGSGKSTLLARLQKSDPKYGVALEFDYIEIKDESSDENKKLNVWVGSGDPYHANLLKYALNEKNFGYSCCMVTISFSEPWNILDSLEEWLKILQLYIDRLKINPDDMKVFKDSLVRHFQEYSEPDLDKENQSVLSKRRDTDFNYLHPNSNDDSEKIVIPLEEGTFEKNLGIPIIVVITKTDSITTLEQDYEYNDDKFDFIQMHLRKICLKYGAALCYISLKDDRNCDLLLNYLLHRYYGFSMRNTASIIEKDAIFIPAGWDNNKKINILIENLSEEIKKQSYNSYITKPISVVRAHAQNRLTESEVAEDEQVFLMKQQALIQRIKSTGPSDGSINKDISRSGSTINSSSTRGRKNVPGLSNSLGTTTNTGAQQANEGVLANFFSSLLNKRGVTTGSPTPNHPMNSSELLRCDDSISENDESQRDDLSLNSISASIGLNEDSVQAVVPDAMEVKEATDQVESSNSNKKDTHLENEFDSSLDKNSDCVINEYESKNSVSLLKDGVKFSPDSINLCSEDILDVDKNEVINEVNGKLKIEEMENDFVNSEIQNDIQNINNIEMLNNEANDINDGEALDKDQNEDNDENEPCLGSTQLENELEFNSIQAKDLEINEELNVEFNNMGKATKNDLNMSNFKTSISTDESLEAKMNMDENDSFNNKEELCDGKASEIESLDNNENLLTINKEYQLENLGEESIDSITESSHLKDEENQLDSDNVKENEENVNETSEMYAKDIIKVNPSQDFESKVLCEEYNSAGADLKVEVDQLEIQSNDDFNNKENLVCDEKTPDNESVDNNEKDYQLENLEKENIDSIAESPDLKDEENQLNLDSIKGNEENVIETSEMCATGIIKVDSQLDLESKVVEEDNSAGADLKLEVDQLEIQSNDDFNNKENLGCDEKTPDNESVDNNEKDYQLENLEKENINNITEKICETPYDVVDSDEQEYLSETVVSSSSTHNSCESPDLKDKENQLNLESIKGNEENVIETSEMCATGIKKVESQQDLESKVGEDDNSGDSDLKIEADQLE